MGWYADGLVDALDYFPANHPKRKDLIGILNRLVNAVEKTRSRPPDYGTISSCTMVPGKEKNYFEASASSQFVYAIAKGVRLGYLPLPKSPSPKKDMTG